MGNCEGCDLQTIDKNTEIRPYMKKYINKKNDNFLNINNTNNNKSTKKRRVSFFLNKKIKSLDSKTELKTILSTENEEIDFDKKKIKKNKNKENDKEINKMNRENNIKKTEKNYKKTEKNNKIEKEDFNSCENSINSKDSINSEESNNEDSDSDFEEGIRKEEVSSKINTNYVDKIIKKVSNNLKEEFN